MYIYKATALTVFCSSNWWQFRCNCISYTVASNSASLDKCCILLPVLCDIFNGNFKAFGFDFQKYATLDMAYLYY